jgi:hypothetical protein
LDARASETGKPADGATALALLRSFGAPQDVAERYRPSGLTIIRPSDARSFAMLSLGGVALQWALSLIAIFTGHHSAMPLPVWIFSWGLGAFWWPGVLVTIQLATAWLRNRNDERILWMPDRILDRDRINRPLMTLAVAFWFVGAATLIALPWLGQIAPFLPRPLIAAFAFDPTFLRERALFVLPLWALSFALQMSVIAAGRWTRRMRRYESFLSAAWAALLCWFVLDGHIFQQLQAENTVKLALAMLAILSLGMLIASFLRERRRLPLAAQL